MKTAEVRKLLERRIDTVSHKAGVYTARRGFFYSHGKTAADLVAAILKAIPDATILDSGEVFKPFRGGATVRNQSHWWVTFRVPTTPAK